MSALVCIFHRDGTAVRPSDLDRLAAPLAPRGGPTATFCRGPLAIAVRHLHGSDPVGDHGPRVDPETGRVVAMAGWLQLPQPSGDAAPAGPSGAASGGAAAMLDRLARAERPPAGDGGVPQHDLLPGSRGSFALLMADPREGWLRIARDHLGDLPVYYVLDRHRLLAATDAAALLHHPAVSGDVDEASVARFLGFRFGAGAGSFFRQVRQLPPAHRLHVGRDRDEVKQYWRFRRRPPGPDRPPEEVADDFLHRLEESVAASVAGLDPARVGLSLSGGLDSTAVAAVAPRGVRAFSWYFEATPEADERAAVEAVSHHLSLPVTWLRGDALHPLCEGFAERFVHPGSPFVNPFAALKCRLYEAAREAGCERVLVGDGGDAPYAAAAYWLRDLLAHRRPGSLASLAGTLGRGRRGDAFARLALRRLLPAEGLRRVLRRDPPWLTPWARSILPAEAPSPILPPGPGRARHDLTVGIKHSELESEERRLFATCGVGRANPFWSWPLLEMAIQLPAWWYHRDGRHKVLSRLALRGRLPESVLEASRGGLLGAFFLRGLELRRDELRETVFRHPRSDWQRYVRADRVEPYLGQTRAIAFGHTLLWRVVSYELWHRRRLGGS